MKRIAFLLSAVLSMAALAQTQVPITGTATIPNPLPGPAGPQGPPGAPGAAGASPSAASVEALLATDPAFIKAVAGALGSSSSGGSSSSSSSSSSSGGSSSSSGGATTTQNCPLVSGTLSATAKVTRSVGISPLLVFFDATGTTDTSLTGGTTAFQELQYSWSFADAGPSGTSTWTNGSSPGRNSKNAATGAIAAHLYQTAGKDAPYQATLTVKSATATVSCLVPLVIVYDGASANGFAGAKTTCAATALPVAGAGGCPAGAQVLATASFNTALGSPYFGAGKRVLFHCGDRFAGDGATLNGVTWSVGAYGGCEGTKVNRPIFNDPGSAGAIIVGYTAGDGRIADIDFEGASTGAAAVTTNGGNTQINYQISLVNLTSTGNSASFAWSQGAQWGLIDSAMNGMRTSIGTFVNYNENNPSTWAAGNAFKNLDYQAIVGNLLNGIGNQSVGSGQEVLRISACRLCAIENNTVENANAIGAVIKLHNGNTNASLAIPWSGVYTEWVEISDNLFAGTSGGIPVDIEPQNNNDDERLRNLIFERNLLTGNTGAWGGSQMRTAVVNETIRNNVFVMNSGGAQIYPEYAIEAGQLGIEPAPANLEVYNNTCFIPTPQDNLQGCFALNGFAMKGPPLSSVTKNNLLFAVSGTHTMIATAGAGNVQSNNSPNGAASPGFANGSGSYGVLADFKPTANYAGAAAVPVYTDALGAPVGPTPYLGAVHP